MTMPASVLIFAVALLTLGAFYQPAAAQESSVSTPYSQENAALGQYRPTVQTTYNQLPTVSGSGYCSDQLQKCSFWASTGECNVNPTYMHAYCKQSCGDCSGSTGDAYGANRPITPVTVGYNAVPPVSSSYGRGSGTYLGGLTGGYGYGSSGYGGNGYGSNGYGSGGYGGNGYGSSGYGSGGYGSNGYGSGGYGGNGHGSTGYGGSGYGSGGYGGNGYGSNGYGSGQCIDLHIGCANWAAYGHCTINPTYMLQYCRQSCAGCNPPVLPTYPQQPYLGQVSNGYGSGYIQPVIPSTAYGGVQQPLNGGYIQPHTVSYGQTASGYGQTSSGYGQTSSGYGQAESTFSQLENTAGSNYVPESRPSGYSSHGSSYVSPTVTPGEYTEKKDKKKLVAAKN